MLLFFFYFPFFIILTVESSPNSLDNGITSWTSEKEKIAGIYPLSAQQIDQGITVEYIGTKMGVKNAKNPWEKQVEEWGKKWKKIKDKIDGQKRKKDENGKKEYFSKLYDSLKMDHHVLLSNHIRKASTDQYSTDSTDVIEILVTTTNSEKDKAGISETFCNKLAQEKEITGNFKKLLIPLCKSRRDEQYRPEQNGNQTDKKIIERLNELVSNPNHFGTLTENDILVNAFVTFSYPKLRNIFKKFEEKYGDDIGKKVNDVYFEQGKHLNKNRAMSVLKLEFTVEQHFWQTLHALITDIKCGRPCYFAQLLSEKLDKLRSTDKWGEADALNDVMRILLTRAPIDLADIYQEFSKYNKISILDFLNKIIEEAKEKKRKGKPFSRSFTGRSKPSKTDDDDEENDGTTISAEVSSSYSAPKNEKPSQKIETLEAFKEIIQWADKERRAEEQQAQLRTFGSIRL